MFVQVIQGRTKDPDALRERIREWRAKVMPGAIGFLGSTGGITDDGEVIVAARFESADAAAANSQRPEQSDWWAETEKLFDGDVAFYDCEEVDLIHEGGSDDAGFVQVIQGYATDVDALRDLGLKMQGALSEHRPDVIGGFVAWGPNKGFSQFMYFTSEEEARRNEAKEIPSEVSDQMRGFDELVTDLKYLDLRDPEIISP